MRIELAPLDGISDRPFRIICRRCGAAQVTTEMIPVQGIVSSPKRYLKKADFSEEERPLTIQIAGSDASLIKKAVSIINPLSPDYIELNAGCPAKRILKSGNGAALLKDLAKLSSCIQAVVDSSKFPVSVKTRTGFDLPVPEEIASVFEGKDVECLKIHGRTAVQNYSTEADLEKVKHIASLVKIPVVANGDINSMESAVSALEKGNFAGVMIGRAARGNPWIFSGIIPCLEERQKVMEDHCRMSADFYGEERGMILMRKHLLWYLKGMINSKQVRAKASRVTSLSEALMIIESLKGALFNIF